MRKFVIVLCLAIGVSTCSYGQSTNNFNHAGEISRAISIPNSPEANAFATYGNTEVNLFTGTPNVQVPIYVHKGREMSLPISFSYASNGIKVNQLATGVGLGWNLAVGGRISRVVNGQPDEYTSITGLPYYSFWDSSVQSKILQYRDDPTPSCFPSQQAANDYLLFLRDVNKGKYDTQPDFFQLSAPGLTETIVFNVSSQSPVALNNPRLEISYTRENNGGTGAQRSIETWIITSDNGTKYYFGNKNGSVLEDVENTRTQNTDDIDGDPPIGYSKDYNSSWALTKIVSPNGKDTYEFIYDNNLPYWAASTTAIPGQMDEKDISGTGTGGITSTIYTNYRIKQVVLKEIKYNGEKFAVIDYGSRNDIAGVNSRVDKVTIYTDFPGSKYKTFELNQSYFKKDQNVDPNSTQPNFVRLRLDEVIIKDKTGAQEEEYTFEYFGNFLPSTTSLGMDYMGYPNNNDNASVLYPPFDYGGITWFPGATRTATTGKGGMLSRITYPTGGYTVFDYEQNMELTYESEIQNQQVIYADETLATTSASLPNVDPNLCNAVIPGQGEVTPEVQSATFRINQSGHHSVDFTITGTPPLSALYGYLAYIVAINEDGNGNCVAIDYGDVLDANCQQISNNIIWPVDNGNGSDPYEDLVWLDEGCYQVFLVNPYAGVTLDIEISGYEETAVLVPVYNAKSGSRVKEIKDYSAPGVVANHKVYEYPSGTVAFKADQLTTIKPRQVQVGSTVQTANILTRVGMINGGSTPHIVYPKVIEKILDENGLASSGYNVYNFKAASSYYRNGIYTIPSLSGLGSNNVNNYAVDYGLGMSSGTGSYEDDGSGTSPVLKTSTSTKYDYAQYYEQKAIFVETDPNYSFAYAVPTNSNGCWSIQRLPGSYDPALGETVFGGLTPPPESFEIGQNQEVTTDPIIASLVLRPNYIKGRGGQMTERTNRQFENGKELSQTTYYRYYDNNLTKSGTSYSAGEVIADPSQTTVVNTENNLLKLTITTNSEDDLEITKYFYPENFVSDYGTLEQANMVNIPVQTENFRAGNLIATQKTLFSGTLPETIRTEKAGSGLEDRLHFDRYVDDNLVEYHQDLGAYTTVIWGYGHRYPVAKIENATYNQVTGIINYNSIQSLDGIALENALQPLRSGLPNALVTTYTYFPEIGMATQTTPDGYTSSFVYDDFHRLLYVKDKDGNVIKEYGYNYRLNDTGGGSTGGGFDPLQVGGITTQNLADDPTSFYSGNVTGLSGGSGDFTYVWSYQLDNTGSFTNFDVTTSNSYQLPYDIHMSSLCDYTWIKFRCKVIDNQVSNSSVTVTMNSSVSINCTGNQQ